jgi:hypothetical protein
MMVKHILLKILPQMCLDEAIFVELRADYITVQALGRLSMQIDSEVFYWSDFEHPLVQISSILTVLNIFTVTFFVTASVRGQ